MIRGVVALHSGPQARRTLQRALAPAFHHEAWQGVRCAHCVRRGGLSVIVAPLPQRPASPPCPGCNSSLRFSLLYPAAAILKAVTKKPVAEVADRMLILPASANFSNFLRLHDKLDARRQACRSLEPRTVQRCGGAVTVASKQTSSACGGRSGAV